MNPLYQSDFSRNTNMPSNSKAKKNVNLLYKSNFSRNMEVPKKSLGKKALYGTDMDSSNENLMGTSIGSISSNNNSNTSLFQFTDRMSPYAFRPDGDETMTSRSGYTEVGKEQKQKELPPLRKTITGEGAFKSQRRFRRNKTAVEKLVQQIQFLKPSPMPKTALFDETLIQFVRETEFLQEQMERSASKHFPKKTVTQWAFPKTASGAFDTKEWSLWPEEKKEKTRRALAFQLVAASGSQTTYTQQELQEIHSFLIRYLSKANLGTPSFFEDTDPTQFRKCAKAIQKIRGKVDNCLDESAQELQAMEKGVRADFHNLEYRSIHSVKKGLAQLKNTKDLGKKEKQFSLALETHLELLYDVQTINPQAVVVNDQTNKEQIIYQHQLGSLDHFSSPPQPLKLGFATDIARALRMFQRMGTAHLDCAPRNFVGYFTEEGKLGLQMIDFDTMKEIGERYQEKGGALRFLPIDLLQATEEKYVHKKSELYSLPLILMKIWGDQMPYGNLSNKEILQKISLGKKGINELIQINAEGVRKAIQKLHLSTEEEKLLIAFMEKCLAANPDDRPDLDEAVALLANIGRFVS